ncbi:hypothetical protein A5724_10550 [Mycobacterium sp. ACS1612]|uniref:DUF3800 domain-containing protein n=1 Tax=Mycobacterium sp. ACS1612 TaxID=1834117 RepID=UPI0007FEF004|nr:DUF3800 domain-containing protein [Mycobacterium sp. ACS1612]OBF38158.1 hypothetical protein A5724_10550 [Mycobacterium sp. ACS1612]
MLVAYIDESGNTGDPSKGGSHTFVLGCVLVDADAWPEAFDGLLRFRRRIRDKFGVHMRAEIKANYLLRNSGDLRPYALGQGARHVIYRAHLRILASLGVRAFAIVIDKRTGFTSPTDCFDMAWEALLQRLERTSTKEQTRFLVVHDEGENDAVRRWVRRARRYLTAGSAYGAGGGTIVAPATQLIDDPVARQSTQSYFIQLADLLAYAAFRSVVPPSPNLQTICPQGMWAEVGDATHRKVAALKPLAAAGIVLRNM